MRSCVLYVLRFPSRYARCLGEALSIGLTTDGPPSHPLQAGVIPEALRRALYKFLGQKGGALQMRTVRTKEEKRVLQEGTDYSSQGPVGAEIVRTAQSLDIW